MRFLTGFVCIILILRFCSHSNIGLANFNDLDCTWNTKIGGFALTMSILRATLYAQLGDCQYQRALLREQIDTLNTLAFPTILKGDGQENRNSVAAIMARKGYVKQGRKSAMEEWKEKWNREVEAFAQRTQNNPWPDVGEWLRNMREGIKGLTKNN